MQKEIFGGKFTSCDCTCGLNVRRGMAHFIRQMRGGSELGVRGSWYKVERGGLGSECEIEGATLWEQTVFRVNFEIRENLWNTTHSR